MGKEATIARRKVVSVAEECLRATNQAIALAETAATSVNGLTVAVGKDVADLQKRATNQGALILSVESNAVHKAALPKVLEALDRDIREQMRRHIDFTDAKWAARGVMVSLKWWQRLRWLFTGALPPYTQREHLASDLPWEHP